MESSSFLYQTFQPEKNPSIHNQKSRKYKVQWQVFYSFPILQRVIEIERRYFTEKERKDFETRCKISFRVSVKLGRNEKTDELSDKFNAILGQI